MEFPGLVEQAKKFVPELKKKGCDVVIISAHSGADTSSSYGDALPYPENAASLVAEQVPDVDAILVGHAHEEIPQRFVTNDDDRASRCCSCEPLLLGHAARGDGPRPSSGTAQAAAGRWSRSHGQLLNSNTVAENPQGRRGGPGPARQRGRLRQLRRSAPRPRRSPRPERWSRTCRSSTSSTTCRPTRSRPALHRRRRGAAGAVDRRAVQPVRVASRPGEVTVRDVAGLYIYDNTLLGGEGHRCPGQGLPGVLGALLQAGHGAGPFPMADVTNAVTPTAPNGTPDYNFDSVAGLDAQLTYDIDIGQAGRRADHRASRTTACRSTAAQQFVLAVNNYRQSRWRRLPARLDRARGLQPPGRDPPAAHRLGDRQRRHRPGRRSRPSTGGWSPTARRSSR